MLLHSGHTQGLRAKIRRQSHASQVVRQIAALIGLTLIDNGGGCLRTQTCVPHLTDEQLDAAGLRLGCLHFLIGIRPISINFEPIH